MLKEKSVFLSKWAILKILCKIPSNMFWQSRQTKFRNSNILNFQNIAQYIKFDFVLVNYTWTHKKQFFVIAQICKTFQLLSLPVCVWKRVESGLWISTTDTGTQIQAIHTHTGYCMCWAGDEETIQKRLFSHLLEIYEIFLFQLLIIWTMNWRYTKTYFL